MKLEERNGLRVLTPQEGYKLQRKGDSNDFSSVVYLGKNDSEDSYTEISDSRVARILAEREAEQEVIDTDYEDVSESE